MKLVQNASTVHVVVGQKVYSGLYGGRHGIVFKITGEQTPENITPIHGGVIVTGGDAHFHIVFENGGQSIVPEGIVRGVQWNIFEDIASPDDIREALLFSNAETIRRETEEKLQANARDQRRRDAIANNPHLHQVAPGQYAGAAHGAKNLRIELKRAFPGVKFSVTSDTYSGGDAIRIKWSLGPTSDQVEAIAGKYEEGRFNGMEDIYENDKENVWPSIFGGAKYVSTSRNYPDEIHEQIGRALCALQQITYAGPNTRGLLGDNDSDNLQSHTHRLLWITPFPQAQTVDRVESTDDGRSAWFSAMFEKYGEGFYGSNRAKLSPEDETAMQRYENERPSHWCRIVFTKSEK